MSSFLLSPQAKKVNSFMYYLGFFVIGLIVFANAKCNNGFDFRTSARLGSGYLLENSKYKREVANDHVSFIYDTTKPTQDTAYVPLYQMSDTIKNAMFLYSDQSGIVHFCRSGYLIVTGFAKVVNKKMQWANTNQNTITGALDEKKKRVYQFIAKLN